MRTAQVFASAVPLAVLEPWATAAVAWDAALVGRASPNVLLTRLRPGTEETLHGFWTPGYGCVVVDKAVIARCDALLVMAGLDGDGLDGLDGLAPVANALKIDCAVSAVPLSAAAVTHLLTEAPATWATVGNTHRKLQICSLSQCLEPSGSSSCPRNGCLASAGYALSPQAPALKRTKPVAMIHKTRKCWVYNMSVNDVYMYTVYWGICIDEKKIDPHFHLSHFSLAVRFQSKCPAWGRLESQPGLEACQSPGVLTAAITNPTKDQGAGKKDCACL